jgi:oxygen-independent coproporphyrinogen-3 oxidase
MEAFVENFHAARAAGFDNINVDLMFALPDQTMKHWLETLAAVIALSPEHISVYSLTPAENTPLWAQIENGEVTMPCDKTDRDMYHAARSILSHAGYTHYEISNFAKKGSESRHNVNCWTMKPYIGFGAGAHSFDGKARWCNREVFQLSQDDLMSETMILGLRLTSGVCENEFAEAFGVTPSEIFKEEIAQLIKDGLLERKQSRILLTSRGLDFANRVFLEFI